MIKGLLSLYSPTFPRNIIYMLQSTEYQVGTYLKWYWRTDDFRHVAKRRSLQKTKAAKLLLLALNLGILLQILIGLLIAIFSVSSRNNTHLIIGIIIIGAYPVVWAHLITLPLLVARFAVVKPKERKLMSRSKQLFGQHNAVKIAVAGSYGKTTVKELLLTVLSEGKRVAATPANKNVAVSHAAFASRLSGDEEVVIIEYGEGEPGDVERFSETTQPDIGIITGIAPAHLDKYKTLDAAAKDIFSLAVYLKDENVYVNNESSDASKYIKPTHITYDHEKADSWKISDIEVKIDGLEFVMTKNKQKLKLTSGLIGRHLVGPLALCVVIADKLDLTAEQIKSGIAKTAPFEHRMQPRMLAGGWVIDDTYNGNLEGIRAGLALLKELDATRKIYVTPGLVDQGEESEKVHRQMGGLIADANPTQVVLMKNSVTKWIQDGLTKEGYKGKIVIENEPLDFYTNLDQLIAVGDVILMQNDWTDNYN